MLRKPILRHAMACFFASISGALCIGRFGKAFLTTWIPYPVILILVGLFMLAVWVAGITAFWKKHTDDSIATTTAFWQNVTRYFLTMNMVMAGLQKFVRLQFDIPLRIFDHAYKDLHGDLLVASFFARSMPFFYLIGVLEIATALMLIFRRTQLLGAILMLPILLNIQMIDVFYAFNIGMSIHVILLVVICLYLILVEYSRLKYFFFVAQSNLPQFNFKQNTLKNAIRYSVIYIPVILLLICDRYPRNYPEVFGKYNVVKYSWGTSKVIPRTQVYNCDSVLTKVFIDSYALVLEYNNVQRRIAFNYKFNSATKTFKAIGLLKHNAQTDTLIATFQTVHGSKQLTGRVGQVPFHIIMQKVNY